MKKVGQYGECQSQSFGKDIVKQNYALENNFNRLNCPRKLIIGESTFEDIFLHMTKRQRLTSERARKLLTTAGTMSKHKYPVDLLNPDPDNFIQHMDFREDIEQVHPSVLKYEWIIMQKFLTAYGIEFGKGTDWFYKPPSIPPPKQRWLPFPDEMYNILHYNYSKNKLKNAFIQYSLTFSVIFGWRNPSELCLQKISDIDLKNCKITITEKKKHFKKRTIVPDYIEIFNNKKIKSLKNWIEIWRSKLSKNKEYDDYLFVRLTDGTPLTEMQYTRFIDYYVKKIFPKFTLYSTREFCATRLLIAEYIKSNKKHWNKSKVQRQLGHERIDTTTKYTNKAEQLIKIADFDWFKRILRQHKKWLEENTLKSTKSKKTYLSSGNSPDSSEIPEHKQTVFK